MMFMLFMGTLISAQTTEVKKAKCDITKCSKKTCDEMVKAGTCTPEEAAKCMKKGHCEKGAKATKVASAQMEKSDVNVINTVNTENGKAVKSCSKSASKSCSKKEVKSCSKGASKSCCSKSKKKGENE